MRLIGFCVLAGWLTVSANAQTRHGEDRCGASNFACRPEVLKGLKACEQNYRIGGDWLNPTYNDPRYRSLWEKWFDDLVRLAAHQTIGIGNVARPPGESS